MKNKERLLSFSEPTRFIFSHSALREGWDNPNVFQICTLKISQSTISKRQEIGRGLRICVNSNGDRMDSTVLEGEFFDYNTLTVIASESYETFAKDLQKEILDSLSGRPTKLAPDVFKNRVLKNSNGDRFVFDDASSMNLIFDFKMKGYIDADYKVTDKFTTDVEAGNFSLPSEFSGFEKEVASLVHDIYATDRFSPVENEKDQNVNEPVLRPNANFARKEFQELWSKINVITTYEVDFESDELIQNAIRAIDSGLEVNHVKVSITYGEQSDQMDEESLKSNSGLTKLAKQTEQTKSILGNVRYDLI